MHSCKRRHRWGTGCASGYCNIGLLAPVRQLRYPHDRDHGVDEEQFAKLSDIAAGRFEDFQR